FAIAGKCLFQVEVLHCPGYELRRENFLIEARPFSHLRRDVSSLELWLLLGRGWRSYRWASGVAVALRTVWADGSRSGPIGLNPLEGSPDFGVKSGKEVLPAGSAQVAEDGCQLLRQSV